MQFARTLSLRVMRETLVYCSLAFAVLTLVLLTQNLLRRIDELLLVGMTGHDIGQVMLLILPIAFSYAIPLAFLLGVLLALRRMSGDGEIGAMRACGIGPTGMLIPFLLLSVPIVALSSFILDDVEHRARRDLVSLFKRVAARGAILEPGKFRHIGHHLVFVEDRGRDGSLAGVMIYDQRRGDRAFRVFASRGRFRFDQVANEILLDLEDGGLHFPPQEKTRSVASRTTGIDPASATPEHGPRPAGAFERYQRLEFESFKYQLGVGHLIGNEYGPVRPKQMTVPELRAVLARAEAGDALRELDQRDPLEYALEIHRRRALPWAPLLLAGIGVPIALATEHRSRHGGLLLAMIAAFGYFGLGRVGEALAAQAWLSASAASWLPNVVYALATLVLIRRGRNRIPD